MPRPSPFKGKETRTTSMRLPVDLLDVMEDLIDLGIYKSKNQIVAEALENLYYELAMAIELRYLAQKRALESGKDPENLTYADVLKAMGEILQEQADDFVKREPFIEAVGKVLAKDPEKAHEVAKKMMEALKK
jgi:Arc/MetJ-type ribon-helix-helix transcriptional regulator